MQACGWAFNAGQATVSAVQHDIAKNLVFEAYLQTLEGEWIVLVSSWKGGGILNFPGTS